MRHVAGYALHNDLSERAVPARARRPVGQGQELRHLRAARPVPRRPPTRCPTRRRCDLWLTVNGERMQDGITADMLFGVRALVSYVSQCMTLLPGDVISTGTPAGVGLGHEAAALPARPATSWSWGSTGSASPGSVSSPRRSPNRRRDPDRRPPALLALRRGAGCLDHRRHGGDPPRLPAAAPGPAPPGRGVRRVHRGAGRPVAERDALPARPRPSAPIHQGRRRLGRPSCGGPRAHAGDARAGPAVQGRAPRGAGGGRRLPHAG